MFCFLYINTSCIPSDTPEQVDARLKLRVNMVSWSLYDRYVMTSCSDFSVKVWDSDSGRLIHVLKVDTHL